MAGSKKKPGCFHETISEYPKFIYPDPLTTEKDLKPKLSHRELARSKEVSMYDERPP